MQVLHTCCCGLDVHKRFVVACLIRSDEEGKQHKELRRFDTLTPELLRLIDWLQDAKCSHVALESTGVYWKPIFNLMEGLFEIVLVNAQHMKAVPGRKADTKDAEWIADLLQHGLLKASFIPPQPQRDLRDLTRLTHQPQTGAHPARQSRPQAVGGDQYQAELDFCRSDVQDRTCDPAGLGPRRGES